jgi:phage tail-like protein
MERDEIIRLLPEVYQRTLVDGSPLASLLDVMAGLIAPAEVLLDHLDDVFSPYRTPDECLAMLASWMDLARFLAPGAGESVDGRGALISSGDGHLRNVVATALTLSQWRGTNTGLCHFLETATGLGGFRIDDRVADGAGGVRPFHIRIAAPAAAAGHEALIRRIARQEKPAYVTYELVFDD